MYLFHSVRGGAVHLRIISANSKVITEALPMNIRAKLRIRDASFQAGIKSPNCWRDTCEECKSLKFHGHLRDLQTPSSKLVSSVKYLEGRFVSIHQSCRKHSNSCFLTSKGFMFSFHWDGNFQMILIYFSTWEKILPFEWFCPALQKCWWGYIGEREDSDGDNLHVMKVFSILSLLQIHFDEPATP